MSSEHDREALRAVSAQSQTVWDTNAAAWDARMGDEGNHFQRFLVAPAAERLLEVQPGQVILDVACGNGVFSRRLARLGAQVVACDFSAALLEKARARTLEHVDAIEYRQVDATDVAQLLALGEGRFDSIVCNMALMDMPAIDPLFSAARRLLKPGGRLVFSVMHPCFNTSGTSLVTEQQDAEGQWLTRRSIRVTEYLGLQPSRGLGLSDQPVPQHYWHRPLQVLLGAGFRAGFSLDGLEEPAFGPEFANPGNPLSWVNYAEVPPVLVCRMRVLALERAP